MKIKMKKILPMILLLSCSLPGFAEEQTLSCKIHHLLADSWNTMVYKFDQDSQKVQYYQDGRFKTAKDGFVNDTTVGIGHDFSISRINGSVTDTDFSDRVEGTCTKVQSNAF
jgi:hypothetical protein